MTHPIAYATDERRAELRSMPYADYLRTSEWMQVRWRALCDAGHRCRLCARPAVNVHHATYARVGGEWPQDVVALCRACHEVHHVDEQRSEAPAHTIMPAPSSPLEMQLAALAGEILEARRTGNDAIADRLTRERDALFRRAT